MQNIKYILLQKLSSQLKESEKHYNESKQFKLIRVLKRLFRKNFIYKRLLFFLVPKIFKEKVFKAQIFWEDDFYIYIPDKGVLPIYYWGVLVETEIGLTRFLIKNLKKNDIFYDMGANYGFYSMLASKIGCKEIHAFEPNNKIFALLEKNKSRKNNIFYNNIALSDKNQKITFYNACKGWFSGVSSTKNNDVIRKMGYSIEKIQSTTLSDYLSKHHAPTFVKIDVEGSEYEVVKGGKNFFLHNSPIICLEVWREDNKNHIKALKLFEQFGYHLYSLNKHGNIKLIKYSDCANSISIEYQNDNFILKK